MKGVRGEQVEPKPYERSKKFLHITMDARRGRQNWSGPLLYPLIPPLPVALDVTSADQELDFKEGIQSHLRKCLRKCPNSNTR